MGFYGIFLGGMQYIIKKHFLFDIFDVTHVLVQELKKGKVELYKFILKKKGKKFSSLKR